MKTEFDPRRLNVRVFALEAGSLAGEDRLAHFPRLIDEARGLGGESLVTYSAHGEMRPDAAGQQEPWLHLQAQAVLALECQRCLGPVEVDIAVDRWFRFVDSEALAAVEDEESEEDVLVASRAFNLLELVEDEVLMSVPLTPKHADCPQPVQTEAVDPDFEDADQARPNPFAALARLKNGGSGPA